MAYCANRCNLRRSGRDSNLLVRIAPNFGTECLIHVAYVRIQHLARLNILVAAGCGSANLFASIMASLINADTAAFDIYISRSGRNGNLMKRITPNNCTMDLVRFAKMRIELSPANALAQKGFKIYEVRNADLCNTNMK